MFFLTPTNVSPMPNLVASPEYFAKRFQARTNFSITNNEGVCELMTIPSTFRKMMVGGLAATMLLGGAVSAFADNGKGRGNEKHRFSTQVKGGNVQFGNHNVQIILNFNDINGSDVEWARKYIASLASKRVFEGYEDGTFQPRKVITRIEAITAAVRLMGLRDKAESAEEMKTELNFKDADKIESKYPWAVGYVAVAVENDLFLESDESVQPEKEADRLWATTLLVKALKLDDEAKARMNTKLTFADADQIPAGSVGYVAVASEKGLINGYEDNTFRPNRPVTRAELAALLDRTGEQLPDYQANVRTGTVSSVNGNVLTIVKEGTSTQYALHSDALILRKGEKVDASDLQAGDVVKVHVYNNTVTLVEVTNPIEDQDKSQNKTIEGTLSREISGNTLTYVQNGETKQQTVQSSTIYLREGVRVKASSLQVGDEIRIYIFGGVATVVEVTRPVENQTESFTVDGKFSSLTLNAQGEIATISVTQTVYDNTTQVSVYNVSPDVTIVGDASQLTVNRDVQLRGSNAVVTTIEVK